MAPEPDPGASSSSPRRPGASQAARRPQTTGTTRRPTLRMGPLTTTPVPPPEPSGALGRLGSTTTSRLELGLSRSGTTGRLTGSGAQSRSGSGASARPGGPPTSLPAGGTVSLLRARAGDHRLAFDLRGVRHVDELGLPAREAGRLVDLRAIFVGPAMTAGQTLAAAGPGDEPLSLVVDPGEVELLRVGLDAVHPIPWPLAGLPTMACVRAVVVLERAVLLLVDPARLTPGLSPAPSPPEAP